MLLVADPDQRGGDAQAPALGADRPVDQVLDPQLLADLGDRLGGALVAAGPALDDDAAGIDLGERGAGLVGEAERQVVLLGIVRGVREGQDGDRRPRGRRAPSVPGSPHRAERKAGGHEADGGRRGGPPSPRRRPTVPVVDGVDRAGPLRAAAGIGRSRDRFTELNRHRHDVDGRDEPVAATGDGFDVRRPIGGVAQRLPDLADRGVDAGLDVDEDVRPPEPLGDLGARDELSRPLDQQDQQVHRLPPQLHPPALSPQLVRTEVQLELAEAEDDRERQVTSREPACLQCHKAACLQPLARSEKFQVPDQTRTMAGAARDGSDGAVSRRSRHVGAAAERRSRTTMTSNTTHTPVRILSRLGLAVAVLVGPAGARTAHADGLILRAAGTYAIEVTVRDCASGAPAGPVIPFAGHVSRRRQHLRDPRGTRLRAGPAGRRARHLAPDRVEHLQPGDDRADRLRHAGQPARHADLRSDQAGHAPASRPAGRPISHTVTFSDATHATSSGTNAFYTAAGVQYRTGCSTAVLTKVM